MRPTCQLVGSHALNGEEEVETPGKGSWAPIDEQGQLKPHPHCTNPGWTSLSLGPAQQHHSTGGTARLFSKRMYKIQHQVYLVDVQPGRAGPMNAESEADRTHNR